jgi:glycosyltransferase involved in cell wall biosynthesis
MASFSAAIRKMILRLQLALTSSEYRLIKKSGLFDHDFYRRTNPDIDEKDMDLLVHFVKWGDCELRSPSIYFTSHYYLSQLNDDELDPPCPLVHFLEKGWCTGKNPNPLFQIEYYLEHYPDVEKTKENPLVHYLKYGWRRGHLTCPEMKYLLEDSLLNTLLEKNINPLGFLLARKPYQEFDIEYYLDRTPSLEESDLFPWQHYVYYGAAEGKTPLPLFDPHFYRADNPDISSRCMDLFSHYMAGDNAEITRPSEWFDPVFYRRNYMTGKNGEALPLVHYLEHGVFAGNYTDERVAGLAGKPLISIIVPVYNVEVRYLNNCIRSVLHQAYPHWELCVADDCSTKSHVRPLLENWQRRDSRIKVVFLNENRGIAGATAEAIKMAEGDYFAFLDNDDELTVDALYQVVKALLESGADLLYSDEDLIGDDGTCFNTFYKPDYNRELLLCHNYITHLLVVSRTLYRSSGGVRSAMDGAQDYDLVLKLCQLAERVHHIPAVLYHWRASETSTSINHQQKSYADPAGRKAVERALGRLGRKGEVLPTEWNFFYNPHYFLKGNPDVSIIVTWNEVGSDPRDWIEYLCRKTNYQKFEIILLLTENNKEDKQKVNQMKEKRRIQYLFFSDNDTAAARLNLAVSRATGEYLLFTDGGFSVSFKGWLDSLLGVAQFDDIGFVTGRVETREKKEISRVPEHRNNSPAYYLQWITGCSVHMNGLQCSQQVLMVSGEFCLVRKNLFKQFEGIKEELFPGLFGLCDLSLEMHHRGLKNVYSAGCGLFIKKTVFSGYEKAGQAEMIKERTRFQEKWSAVLRSGDPYYNPGCYREAGLADSEFEHWYLGDIR